MEVVQKPLNTVAEPCLLKTPDINAARSTVRRYRVCVAGQHIKLLIFFSFPRPRAPDSNGYSSRPVHKRLFHSFLSNHAEFIFPCLDEVKRGERVLGGWCVSPFMRGCLTSLI